MYGFFNAVLAYVSFVFEGRQYIMRLLHTNNKRRELPLVEICWKTAKRQIKRMLKGFDNRVETGVLTHKTWTLCWLMLITQNLYIPCDFALTSLVPSTWNTKRSDVAFPLVLFRFDRIICIFMLEYIFCLLIFSFVLLSKKLWIKFSEFSNFKPWTFCPPSSYLYLSINQKFALLQQFSADYFVHIKKNQIKF